VPHHLAVQAFVLFVVWRIHAQPQSPKTNT
jgi:hypothetical protein